jgi:hypothetical protein
MVVGFASGEIVIVPGFAPGFERRRIRGLSRRSNFDRLDMARIVTHEPNVSAAKSLPKNPKPPTIHCFGRRSIVEPAYAQILADVTLPLMIRFGTKTLLFIFVLVALWCSTFGGYAAGHDVRASVLLIVLFAAGYSAVYGRGKQRAFWSGFFLVMLLTGGNFFQGPANKYVPNFFWRANVTVQYPSMPVYAAPLPAYRPRDPDPSPNFAPVAPQPAAPTPQVVFVPSATAPGLEFNLALKATIETAWVLALATIVGLLGMWIYVTANLRAQDG